MGPLGRSYERAYRRDLDLDDERVALWKPVQLFHGWSQAVGASEGFFASSEPTGGDERIPDSLAGMPESRFNAALAAVT